MQSEEKKLLELMYSKDFADKMEKLTIGLNEIESNYKELFMDSEFSKYYLINYQPFNFIFLDNYLDELPKSIIDETFKLLDVLFNKKITKGIN